MPGTDVRFYELPGRPERVADERRDRKNVDKLLDPEILATQRTLENEAKKASTERATAQRDKLGRYANGMSGEITTTKAHRALAKLARWHSADAIRTLSNIMMDPQQPGAVRVVAADKLLDRGFGKARSGELLDADDATQHRKISDMTKEQLLAIVAAPDKTNDE